MNPLFKVAIISVLLEVFLMVLSPLFNFLNIKCQYLWLGFFIVIGVAGVTCGVIGAIGVVLGM